MLETVREFGEEETGDDEAVEVTRRMAAWARRLARDLSEGIYGERQIAAVHRVEAEHDTLVAILRAALERADAVTAYHVFPAIRRALGDPRRAHGGAQVVGPGAADRRPRPRGRDPRPPLCSPTCSPDCT